MKRLLLIVALCFGCLQANAQKARLYYPDDNARLMIDNAVEKAKSSGKHVLIAVGGNWCNWCIRFDNFIHDNKKIDSIVKADFVYYHLNYSPENKNLALLARYGNPQRFGFPVFMILDEKGNRIHTQNSEYLQDGNSYNALLVEDFLMYWNRRAVNTQQNNNKK